MLKELLKELLICLETGLMYPFKYKHEDWLIPIFDSISRIIIPGNFIFRN